MTANRAFSKARSRLNHRFERLKELFASVDVSSGSFDDVIVAFVDEDPSFYREVENRDRVYQVNVGLPSGDFKLADERLLMAIAGQLRKVIEHAPTSEERRAEMRSQLSSWESEIRQ